MQQHVSKPKPFVKSIAPIRQITIPLAQPRPIARIVPIKQAVSPIRQIASTKQVAQPVIQQAPAVKQVAQTIKHVAESIQHSASPIRQVALPFKHATAPVQQVAQPIDTEPVKPIQQVSQSIQQPIKQSIQQPMQQVSWTHEQNATQQGPTQRQVIEPLQIAVTDYIFTCEPQPVSLMDASAFYENSSGNVISIFVKNFTYCFWAESLLSTYYMFFVTSAWKKIVPERLGQGYYIKFHSSSIQIIHDDQVIDIYYPLDCTAIKSTKINNQAVPLWKINDQVPTLASLYQSKHNYFCLVDNKSELVLYELTKNKSKNYTIVAGPLELFNIKRFGGTIEFDLEDGRHLVLAREASYLDRRGKKVLLEKCNQKTQDQVVSKLGISMGVYVPRILEWWKESTMKHSNI